MNSGAHSPPPSPSSLSPLSLRSLLHSLLVRSLTRSLACVRALSGSGSPHTHIHTHTHTLSLSLSLSLHTGGRMHARARTHTHAFARAHTYMHVCSVKHAFQLESLLDVLCVTSLVVAAGSSGCVCVLVCVRMQARMHVRIHGRLKREAQVAAQQGRKRSYRTREPSFHRTRARCFPLLSFPFSRASSLAAIPAWGRRKMSVSALSPPLRAQ